MMQTRDERIRIFFYSCFVLVLGVQLTVILFKNHGQFYCSFSDVWTFRKALCTFYFDQRPSTLDSTLHQAFGGRRRPRSPGFSNSLFPPSESHGLETPALYPRSLLTSHEGRRRKLKRARLEGRNREFQRSRTERTSTARGAFPRSHIQSRRK